MSVDWDNVFKALAPKITGGWGLVQPGNPFPIVVFGENFGPAEGRLILEGKFGTRILDILEWGADGKFASAYMPDDICGIFDHEATIKVVTTNFWESNAWPVQFTAARETKLFPRSEVQVLACSDDSNKDCCSSQCDSSDGDWFSTCGSANSGICGFHYNVWGAVGNDSGTDKYRIDLTEGAWAVEHWDFSVSVDPGEGWASLKNPNAYQEKIADFEIDWMVTPNDFVSYDVDVFISGPCGTSHKAGVATSALTGIIKNLKALAHSDAASAKSLNQLERIEHRIKAGQMRRAAAQDQRTQQALKELRTAVSDAEVKKAQEHHELRDQINQLRLTASSRNADAKRVKAEADAILQRLERTQSRKE